MFTFGSFGDTQEDVDRGEKILSQFHMYASRFPDYGLSFEELKSKYTAKSPAFLESLGFAANASGEFLTDAKTEEAMQALANAGQGKIPQNPSSFFNSLNKSAQNVSWWDAIPFVATETGKTVAEGLERGGSAIIQVAEQAEKSVGVWKYAIWLLPLFLGVAVMNRVKGKQHD